jgi:hypothetical protein
MLVRSLAIAAALPALALAQGFEYAPGTSQYRVTNASKVTQEMMGQKQSGETTANQLLTVTLTRAARDTIAGVLVLDSISAGNNMGMPSPSLAHLQGLKVNTRMSPSGAVVYSVSGPKEEEVPNASQLTLGMGAFMPKIKGKLAKGSTWRDTTGGVVRQFGIDLTRTVISSYAVVGDTTVAGEAAWKVSRADSITVAGSGVGQSGAMTLEGNSASKGHFVVSSKGAYLGAESGEEGNIRVVLSANGAEISVTSSATTKVQRVK